MRRFFALVSRFLSFFRNYYAKSYHFRGTILKKRNDSL